jgi:methylmalonyl-CoA/ethylmalonyl-CoA epimerase
MITRMSHVGIVVNDLKKAQDVWVNTFGLSIASSGFIEAEGIKNSFLKVGSNFIELMEPINHTDQNNAIARRLIEKGEGVFHIALISDDIDTESKKLAGQGLTLIKRPPSEDQPHGRWVIHPKSANGVLVEILS